MIQCKPRVIDERTKSIPIQKNLSTSCSKTLSEDYSLKQNFFDPTKSSPPNEFMIKLHMRINNMTAKKY
jgi:hypothetical protein